MLKIFKCGYVINKSDWILESIVDVFDEVLDVVMRILSKLILVWEW